METPAPPRPDDRRRKLRRRILITASAGAAVILSGVPAALHLWLASPHGCRWVAAKIRSRTGLEARVTGSTLSPWNGLSIRGVELLQPAPLRASVREPLLRIERIGIDPVWKSWLRGRPELKSLTLESPRLVMPVELLVEIARSRRSNAAAAPAVAETTPTPPLAAQPDPPRAAQEPAAAGTPAGPATDPPPAPRPAALPQPTGWIHFRDASIEIVSASSGRCLLEAAAINGSIPVAGGPAASTLDWGPASIAGHPVLAAGRGSVEWKPPFLRFDAPDARLLGMAMSWSATTALAGGLPVRFEALLPDQEFASTGLPQGLQARASSLHAGLLFRGLLFQPATWQGDFAAAAVSPSGSLAGHEAAFDRGSCAVALRGGMLSCTDARLIGDSLSLLGNGTLLADGRLAAVLRLVAPPEVAEAIARRAFPQVAHPVSLTPLSSPQRTAFDLEARGRIGQIFLRPGREGPILQLQR